MDDKELEQFLEDEKLAMVLQNEEFMRELRHNKDFMLSLEKGLWFRIFKSVHVLIHDTLSKNLVNFILPRVLYPVFRKFMRLF